MLRDITIGQHFPGDSLVHKFDPRMKLVLTIVYIILLFAASNPLGLTLSLVFLVAMYGVAKIPFKLITKSLKPILPIILFTAVLNLFFVSGEGEPRYRSAARFSREPDNPENPFKAPNFIQNIVMSGAAGSPNAARTGYRQVTVVIFIPGYYNTFDATLQYIFCRTGRKKPVHPREKEPERMNEAWKELKQECAQCRRCGLGETRHHLVFGDGAEDARIMLIGEGPGEQEDLQGLPFVGPAGKLLDDMLEMIYLDRTKVYIANIVKCRPPHNRDPQFVEQKCCGEWLQRQIALVDPAIIVCLGRIAATALIKDPFRITREHGQWFDVNGRRCMAIYHPSALLRDPSKRPETFVDLKALQREIYTRCPEVYPDA